MTLQGEELSEDRNESGEGLFLDSKNNELSDLEYFSDAQNGNFRKNRRSNNEIA